MAIRELADNEIEAVAGGNNPWKVAAIVAAMQHAGAKHAAWKRAQYS